MELGIDRIVCPNFEALLALSAAAAVTERIRLATTSCWALSG